MKVVPVHGWGVGTTWSLRFLPAKPFCDLTGLFQECLIYGKCAFAASDIFYRGNKKHLQTAFLLSQVFKAKCVTLMLLGQWGWEFHRGACKSSGFYTRWVTPVLALCCGRSYLLPCKKPFYSLNITWEPLRIVPSLPKRFYGLEQRGLCLCFCRYICAGLSRNEVNVEGGMGATPKSLQSPSVQLGFPLSLGWKWHLCEHFRWKGIMFIE